MKYLLAAAAMLAVASSHSPDATTTDPFLTCTWNGEEKICTCPTGFYYNGENCIRNIPTPTKSCQWGYYIDIQGNCVASIRTPSPTTCLYGIYTDYRGPHCNPSPTVNLYPCPTPSQMSCSCYPGYYNDYRGHCRRIQSPTPPTSTSTSTCLWGYYTDYRGHTRCSPSPTPTSTCPWGYYTDYRGHTRCSPSPTPTPCPTDYYEDCLDNCWAPSETATATMIYGYWDQFHHCVCPTGWTTRANVGTCYRELSSTPSSTATSSSSLVCPPGSEPDGMGGCKPFYLTTSTATASPSPGTTCGGYNSTNCTPTPPGPTVITKTEHHIETLTVCPSSTTCHGQTVTWTHTYGPTSCPPVVTCTCVLPGGYPTLTSCPRSVTCTGQTTTITEGVTVVLPSESLPTPNVPPQPSSTPPLELGGAAATGGVGLMAILFGAFAAL
ncbi:hypothetical protein CC78DRAFT_546318 [Lojkania enalia]|uniref:EGF-like domain-containing protein n=1 Tax=Lojkania enalia TaxID=147567 RepID=A0A9P4K6H9_9PLEO|nr:hypothetical protein CC78DRAFT_546318 [Didymosphaeria enalia]